jgi:biotin transport system substrate-specific component
MTTTTAEHTESLSTAAWALPRRILLGLAATLAVAAAAHVTIPLPFTPVPFTLQPLAVLCVGLALGPVAGFFTLLAYLAEGMMGIPVFSPTGPGGLAQLLGPTGGFLMSYPLVAALAGGLTRLLRPRLPAFWAATAGSSLATAVLFACGAAWLLHLAHLSIYATWLAAIAPFLPGEAVKVLLAASFYSTFASRKSV